MRPIDVMLARGAIGGGGGDPYWSSVSSLLHFDGTDASTTFTDETGKTWAASGNAQIDTAKSKFGGASGLFDGSGDYISTASHAGFGFGSGDFTIEGWVHRAASGSDQTILDTRTVSNEGIGIYATVSSGVPGGFTVANNATVIAKSTKLFSTGAFTHFAVVRDGTTLYGYMGGVQELTVTDSRTYASASTCRVGASYLATQGYPGWLDDLRITKGVCRYPGGTTFTPPTGPFPDS